MNSTVENIKLNPLRKNSRKAGFVVYNLTKEGFAVDHVFYETLREAVAHMVKNRSGHVTARGSRNGLKAFWCEWSNAARFGYGADDYEKSVMERDMWWAEWNTNPL